VNFAALKFREIPPPNPNLVVVELRKTAFDQISRRSQIESSVSQLEALQRFGETGRVLAFARKPLAVPATHARDPMTTGRSSQTITELH